MSVVGIRLTGEIAELRGLQEALGQIFTDQQKTEILKKALKLAIKPTFLRLKELAPLGPTGNLKRAVREKIKGYSRSGNAVGLVGFTQAARDDAVDMAGPGSTKLGKDRAFHQWFVENGTRARFVQSTKLSNTPYQRRPHTRTHRSGTVFDVRGHQVSGQNAIIASSFGKRGQVFDKNGNKTPFSFFKKGKKGESSLRIEPMPAGGITGQPPLQTAWDQTKATVAEILQRELRLTLSQALESLARFPGTLSG